MPLVNALLVVFMSFLYTHVLLNFLMAMYNIAVCRVLGDMLIRYV